ncbi:MAG: efflux RND transporter periplasmic adaptor subunit [Deltaproteobacteria bacterium]|nr:efflux RND transporter periplasmic adaptor subunit [Deltaproteobacteria bacterium]
MSRCFAITLFLLAGCAPGPAPHGHSHGGADHHGGGADHHAEDEGESIAITRWTDSHELFVELDAPVVGTAFAYHAHVTRLADNHAATEGSLTLRFEQDGFAVESHTDEAVARPGIFAQEAAAPSKAGTYDLVVTYSNGPERAEWAGGTVVVGATGPEPHEADDEGEIGFLKEGQWQVPFRVMLAAEVELAPTAKIPAMARPAPSTTAVVAAPTDGLLAWSSSLPVVGRRVTAGERLATLIPAGASEHWTRLQADVATARIDLDLAHKELTRVRDLTTRELLPARRLAEAEAAVERATAQVDASERRASALSSGSTGAVSVKAPASGIIVSVGAGHGEDVHAGAPLIGVSSSSALLLEGHVHERLEDELAPGTGLYALRGGWDEPRDLAEAGGRLLTERLIYDKDGLSAPISVLVESDVGLAPGDLVELQIGVGAPSSALAVPRSAIVEVSGQTVVFVQKTGESFTRRRVVLGRSDARFVEVLSGVSAGDMVVVEGGFDVHVASLSDGLESHRH